jgi:hypothetical protein
MAAFQTEEKKTLLVDSNHPVNRILSRSIHKAILYIAEGGIDHGEDISKTDREEARTRPFISRQRINAKSILPQEENSIIHAGLVVTESQEGKKRPVAT